MPGFHSHDDDFLYEEQRASSFIKKAAKAVESPDDILTATEVCEILKCNRKTLYNYTHSYKGRPPLPSSYRVRGKVLVRRKQLEFFLKKIEVKGVYHLSE
jgi:Helix-turn-helix domain